MDKVDIGRLIECIDIPEIDPNKNFWMVRTQQGYFYEEYIEKGFVALGWNIITRDRIKKCKSISDEKLLLEEIKSKYKNIKQPGRPFSKCVRFIHDIKKDDIIMIPSSKGEEITFALAGEYYEEERLDYGKEIEVLEQIREGWDKTLTIRCPYKKRRKITVLRTISGYKINPNLYKALVSYHGISNINAYADYILSSIFNIYYWNNQINYVFNVEKKKEINPVDISRLIISFAELAATLLENETNIDKLDGKMNINSPGDILLTLKDCANDIYAFLVSNKFVFLAIWLSIIGGSAKIAGNEISTNSLLEYIYKFREQNNSFRNDKLKREVLQKQLSNMTDMSKKLKINTKNYDNVIDLEKYFNEDD